MSSYLWKYYLEDDVDRFRHLLETATYHVRPPAQKGGGAGQNLNAQLGTSPAPRGGTSPLLSAKGRKTPSQPNHGTPGSGSSAIALTRADINWRDSNGLTILHHAASSTAESAAGFAQALLDHPLLDLYLQDLESGWTALHRAFYFGNIAIARAILEKDAQNAFGRSLGGKSHSVLGLIKIKDREGHGPLDLYAATIQDRTLHPENMSRRRSDSLPSDQELTGPDADEGSHRAKMNPRGFAGDECFTFGSNRNMNLGFGDEDDRQWPERVTLKRPSHLLQRFYREHVENASSANLSLSDSTYLASQTASSHDVPIESMPWVVQSRPIKIEDVHMSKLHTAILTDDPEANLHVCGHGPGGRLGLGHEKSQYTFACVEGGALAGKRIVALGLGQNHTLAVSGEGETFSWGSNLHGQLGYSLPRNGRKDDDPVQTLPRQIFGPLKREVIEGVAASRIHSVAFSGSSLYTWGKNEGQLGLVDSDARSLDIQTIPRKVGASLFSTSIEAVSAIDKATVCLLSGSGDCWVFANYGYAKISFPLDTFSNYFLNEKVWASRADSWMNHVVKITAGGDTICAMASNGEIYSLTVSQPSSMQSANASTTNPTKIKASLSHPQRIWSLKKHNMGAKDVGVDADGSIIITTQEGSVWKRSRRAKIRDAASVGTSEYKPRDYKFSRISGLTRVIGVRASANGSYAAIRRDCDVTKTQIAVQPSSLHRDLFPLLSISGFHARSVTPDSESESPEPRFWRSRVVDSTALLKKHILEAKDVESELEQSLSGLDTSTAAGYDVLVSSSVTDLSIPAHQAVLGARSRWLRDRLSSLSAGMSTDEQEILRVESSASSHRLTFLGMDPLTIVNFVLYCYTDQVIDYWHYASRAPKMAHRYRTIRTELMKIANQLGMKSLEAAVRQMISPVRCLTQDMEVSFQDPAFFDNADMMVELAEEEEVAVHSSIVCRRCPFFEGMFMGRAGGRWLEDRRNHGGNDGLVRIDLKHIDAATFRLALRHIYADTDEELFDNVVSADLEDFFDTVMEVLSVANELMLDRLAQICQKVMGRYVNVRNVASLLNAVAPSSVSEFKDASLEYMCLSLEAMLHAGLLDELDPDLLHELDETVRANQLACLPFVKSGRAEALLLERHPELAEVVERNRRAKIDSIAIHAKHQDVENWASNSFRAPSFDEQMASPSQQKARRKSKATGSRQSPALQGKEAVDKLGSTFDESIDMELDLGAPAVRLDLGGGPVGVGSPRHEVWYDAKGKALSPPTASPSLPPTTTKSPQAPSPHLRPSSLSTTSVGAPWNSSPTSTKKLDLKDIMSQTSANRVSSLSASIAASKSSQDPGIATIPKLSQKERKKLLQQQQAAQRQPPTTVEPTAPALRGTPPPKASPWQTVGAAKANSLKAVMHGQTKPSTSPSISKPTTARQPSSTPQLTMRQTIAHHKPPPPPPLPNSSSPQPNNNAPTPSPKAPTSSSPSSSSPVSRPVPAPRTIRHHQHQPRPVEPTIQLSLADILDQQQYEKDSIAKANADNAKRSLQDIQAEQEFQLWWEREERRYRIENGLVVAGEEEGDDGGGEDEERAGGEAAGKKGKKKVVGKAGKGRGRGRGGGPAAAARRGQTGVGNGKEKEVTATPEVQRKQARSRAEKGRGAGAAGTAGATSRGGKPGGAATTQ